MADREVGGASSSDAHRPVVEWSGDPKPEAAGPEVAAPPARPASQTLVPNAPLSSSARRQLQPEPPSHPAPSAQKTEPPTLRQPRITPVELWQRGIARWGARASNGPTPVFKQRGSMRGAGAAGGHRPWDGLQRPPGVSAKRWHGILGHLAREAEGGTRWHSTGDLVGTILRLGAPEVTPEAMSRLQRADRAAMPAIRCAITPYPDVVFQRQSTFDLNQLNTTAVAIEPVAMKDGSNRPFVRVETSLERLLGRARVVDLAEQYAVDDAPLTFWVPWPEGRGTAEALSEKEVLNVVGDQLSDLDAASLFLHGYQSTRLVWAHDMGDWLSRSDGQTFAVAISGMGAEGDFLGSGDNPVTPKHYAFHAMEVLDRLGLYRSRLNVVGHSMGGAAGLELGLALDRMAHAKRDRTRRGRPPDLRLVLLAPAVAADNLPLFGDSLFPGAVVRTANLIGATSWGVELRRISEELIGEAVVDYLLDGAPEYLRQLHEDFAAVDYRRSYNLLLAAQLGMQDQAGVQPGELSRLLERHPTLVVAAVQDRVVDATGVIDVFGAGRVMKVAGHHYPHLPHAEIGPAWAEQVLDAAAVVMAAK